MGRLGITELVIILGVALLLFGGGRMAEVGKGLGEGIRNFKRGLRDDDDEPVPPRLPEPEKGGPPGGAAKP